MLWYCSFSFLSFFFLSRVSVYHPLLPIPIPIRYATLGASVQDKEMYAQHVAASTSHGCIFEAVVGAVYVDSDLDLDEVWRVFSPWLLDGAKAMDPL